MSQTVLNRVNTFSVVLGISGTAACTLLYWKNVKSNHIRQLVFDFGEKMPPLRTLYFRAVVSLFTKPRGLPVHVTKLPELEAVVRGPISIDASHLTKYREMCTVGDEDWYGDESGDDESEGDDWAPEAKSDGLRGMAGFFLPPAYLSAIVFPLQLALLCTPAFPFSPVGALHAHNSIFQARALGREETFSFRTQLVPAVRRTARGHLEFDIKTEAMSNLDGFKTAVWTNVASFVLPCRNPRPAAGAKPLYSSRSAPTLQFLTERQVLARQVKEYSALNGDINPVHAATWTARLFGFRSMISHGMFGTAWGMDAVLKATLPANTQPLSALLHDCHFLRPLLVPADVACSRLKFGNNKADPISGIEFCIHDDDRTYIEGKVIVFNFPKSRVAFPKFNNESKPLSRSYTR